MCTREYCYRFRNGVVCKNVFWILGEMILFKLISHNCSTIFLISVNFNANIIPVSLEINLFPGSVETLGYVVVIFVLGA
jgi:hypothetical protein